MAIPGQSTKPNVHQSAIVAKLENLISAKCITLILQYKNPKFCFKINIINFWHFTALYADLPLI